MKIKSERDFWSGLMYVAVGIAFAWGATAYRFGDSAHPGPAYFPFGLGVLLALIGALVLFKALTIETEDGEKIGAWAWKPLLVIVGAVVVFAWALPHLGMFVALPILVVMAAMAGAEFHWGEVLINATILTVFSWAIFTLGLNLTIPLKPWFMG